MGGSQECWRCLRAATWSGCWPTALLRGGTSGTAAGRRRTGFGRPPRPRARIPAERLSRPEVVARPLGFLRVGERPADAFDQLGREVGVADVGRAHARLELKGASIVPRCAVLGLGVGHDNDAWHVLLAFGSKLAYAGRSANRTSRTAGDSNPAAWRGGRSNSTSHRTVAAAQRRAPDAQPPGDNRSCAAAVPHRDCLQARLSHKSVAMQFRCGNVQRRLADLGRHHRVEPGHRRPDALHRRVIGVFSNARDLCDSVPGGPPPPLKNGNRRGYLQVSLRRKRKRPGPTGRLNELP